MKKSISYIFLFFCFLFVQEVSATNPISVEAFEIHNVSKNEVQKTSFFSKTKKRAKKFLNAALDKSKIQRLGMLALIFGIASLLGWALVAVAGSWLLVVMAALAIAGDVLAIMTLWKTRKERKDHRKARTMAWIGLILSLLTGILPLLLLVLLFATL